VTTSLASASSIHRNGWDLRIVSCCITRHSFRAAT